MVQSESIAIDFEDTEETLYSALDENQIAVLATEIIIVIELGLSIEEDKERNRNSEEITELFDTLSKALLDNAKLIHSAIQRLKSTRYQNRFT